MKAVAIVLVVAFLACAVESKHAPLAIQKRGLGDIVLDLCGVPLIVTGLVSNILAIVLPAVLDLVDLVTATLGILKVLLDVECVTKAVKELVDTVTQECVDTAIGAANTALAALCDQIGGVTGSLNDVTNCSLLDLSCIIQAIGNLVAGTGETVANIAASILDILLMLVASITDCIDELLDGVFDFLPLVLGCVKLPW